MSLRIFVSLFLVFKVLTCLAEADKKTCDAFITDLVSIECQASCKADVQKNSPYWKCNENDCPVCYPKNCPKLGDFKTRFDSIKKIASDPRLSRCIGI